MSAQLTPDQDALDFNPMTSPHREDPHVFYRAAREGPVTFSPSIGAYMVTRYADLVTVLDDPRTFSSRAALPMIYDNPPEVVAVLRAGGVPETTMVVNEDEPEHIRFRRVFDAGFTGARVRAMVPLMRERAAELIESFGAGAADLVADYAVPFVQAVISAVIGFPAGDTAQIQAWTDDVNMLWNMLAPVQARVESARRMAGYTRYLQALIDDRRAHPREDLISDLVHGANGYPGVPDEYVHNMIRGAARVAGFDTTRDAITATVLIMLENPGVRERIVADPARAIPKLTEEALRRDAPHRGLFRITTREVELGGTVLPAGSPMLLLFGSGNRDETVFADPDQVDLDRANVRDHLAFGRGLHSCPGAPMARAEIRVALETLIRRLPGLRLAAGYRPVYIASYFFRGLESLDVTWLRSRHRKSPATHLNYPRRTRAPGGGCIMHVLTVCYGHPADPAAFDAYYTSTHVPLAEKIPGMTSFTYRHCDSLDGSQPPYYLLAELSFPSREALNAALGSPEGRAAAGDVPNFATGGVTMFVAHD